MLKKILLGLILLVAVAQFIRPQKNVSPIASENDIRVHYSVPSNVLSVLKRACFDCHSNNTAYPWYTNIQPVGWWIQHHIDEGKEHFDFSEFGAYSLKKAAHKMEEVAEEIEEGKMPLTNYTWMHADANLTESEKELIITWAKEFQIELETSK